MPIFSPDITQFGDTVGMGLWINTHFYEHQQFITIGLTHGIEFVDYDLLQWVPDDAQRMSEWQAVHNEMHESLRYPLNITIQPFDEFDLETEAGWYYFMQYHAQEHASIRQALGVT